MTSKKVSGKKEYILAVLKQNRQEIGDKHLKLFDRFVDYPAINEAFEEIQKSISKMTALWSKSSRLEDIMNLHMAPGNGMVGKPYSYKFDFSKSPLDKMVDCYVELPPGTGLIYENEKKELSGTPLIKGEFELEMKFKVDPDEADYNTKKIVLVINPDPKSLWKNLESDTSDAYWKEDSATQSAAFGERKIIAASVRGRSHAHEGKFRDDDFNITLFDTTGWALVAVADGAGSAKFSRKGSLIACNRLSEFFTASFTPENAAEIDATIIALHTTKSEDDKKKLSEVLGKWFTPAPYEAFKAVETFAKEKGAPLKDFSTTLLFSVLKKYDFGTAIFSFWLGDGGIGIFDETTGELQVPGTPDGGEFAGQTRFLTDPAMFESGQYLSRVKFQFIPQYTAILLMTDGITDPKFQTDANLNRIEKWQEVWKDIHGNNSDNAGIQPGSDLMEMEGQLLSWMDFWSPGNHDDRTIAIIF